jgi:hypothetical protein
MNLPRIIQPFRLRRAPGSHGGDSSNRIAQLLDRPLHQRPGEQVNDHDEHHGRQQSKPGNRADCPLPGQTAAGRFGYSIRVNRTIRHDGKHRCRAVQ